MTWQGQSIKLPLYYPANIVTKESKRGMYVRTLKIICRKRAGNEKGNQELTHLRRSYIELLKLSWSSSPSYNISQYDPI